MTIEQFLVIPPVTAGRSISLTDAGVAREDSTAFLQALLRRLGVQAPVDQDSVGVPSAQTTLPPDGTEIERLAAFIGQLKVLKAQTAETSVTEGGNKTGQGGKVLPGAGDVGCEGPALTSAQIEQLLTQLVVMQSSPAVVEETMEPVSAKMQNTVEIGDVPDNVMPAYAAAAPGVANDQERLAANFGNDGKVAVARPLTLAGTVAPKVNLPLAVPDVIESVSRAFQEKNPPSGLTDVPSVRPGVARMTTSLVPESSAAMAQPLPLPAAMPVTFAAHSIPGRFDASPAAAAFADLAATMPANSAAPLADVRMHTEPAAVPSMPANAELASGRPAVLTMAQAPMPAMLSNSTPPVADVRMHSGPAAVSSMSTNAELASVGPAVLSMARTSMPGMAPNLVGAIPAIGQVPDPTIATQGAAPAFHSASVTPMMAEVLSAGADAPATVSVAASGSFRPAIMQPALAPVAGSISGADGGVSATALSAAAAMPTADLPDKAPMSPAVELDARANLKPAPAASVTIQDAGSATITSGDFAKRAEAEPAVLIPVVPARSGHQTPPAPGISTTGERVSVSEVGGSRVNEIAVNSSELTQPVRTKGSVPAPPLPAGGLSLATGLIDATASKMARESTPTLIFAAEATEPAMPLNTTAPTGQEVATIASVNPQPPLSTVEIREAEIPTVNTPLGRPGWPEDLGERVIWMAGKELRSAELQLSPQHLGPVEVRISLTQDQTSIQFVTHNAGVREAIEAAIPKLREMLGAQQLHLADVSVTQHSFSEQSDYRGAQFSYDQQSQSGRQGRGAEASEGAAPTRREGEPSVTSRSGSGSLSLYA